MEEKKQIQTRLKKIEGQIKGIEKMIENDMCCNDVLIQIAAVRAAVNKVGGMIIRNYAKTCLFEEGDTNCKNDKIESLVSTLTMFLK
ncbi:metal-sensitive transcriptional regulator [Clostridium ljungdahlii]|uniref:Copper-sensing transcriptional repressor CsoR n=1 Tax=Clostridium ljungdahlii TaxID=1538 RepID=A0A162KSH1_9CLOT|nr:metal-sensitive transcriptional regulator [Clostridium ljungdahlii]OAA83346.1 Copper-sensing transcriptional repressor CsoR [Clostridium ljungdahlii]